MNPRLCTILAILFTALVALGLFQVAPLPVAVFIAGAIPAPLVTIVAISRRRRSGRVGMPIISLAVTAWLVFYVLSTGPTLAAMMRLRLNDKPGIGTIWSVAYGPVIDCFYQSPMWNRKTAWYVDSWQCLGAGWPHELLK